MNGKGENRGREQGFTLLEVVIAMAIISIALVGLLGLVNRSIVVNDRLQRITQATLLAQHKMAEVIDTEDLNADQGSFDEPFEVYNWQVAYSDTPLASVTMVSVTVDWGESSVGEAVILDSFIY
jgi:general secretion pathway protein I